MLGKIKSMISNLASDAYGFLFVKGCAIRLQGAGGSDPTNIDSYNVASAVRSAAGSYRVTLTQGSAFGVAIVGNSFIGVNKDIAPSGATDMFDVDVVRVSSTEFDILIYGVNVGAGVDLVKTPYDILASDTVEVSFCMSINKGRLPPE